ncbi:MAG: NYN domain-containing protein [Bacteriovoracaceae bacterium]
MEEIEIIIDQKVAILIDGNNIERSIHSITKDSGSMLNFDTLIPKILMQRGLSRLIYFREGKSISSKLRDRLHDNYHGSVVPCHKSADIPLSIKATQLASKVDTIIILSGDSDYVELIRHLKAEGVRIEIAAIEQTTSQLLKDEADFYHPIIKDDWFTLTKKTTRKKSRS